MLSDSRKNELCEFLKIINFQCLDLELVDTALTHPSFNFENNIENSNDYERLEFLGDAVLKLVVSKILFDKYPDYNEGQMTKIRGFIISDDFLSKLALQINLNEFVKVGPHEAKNGGKDRPSILACAFEAVLGALYQQGLISEIHSFLDRMYEPYIEKIADNICLYNVKALLQEYTQGLSKSLPVYRVVSEQGKDHNKIYEVEVIYKENIIGVGSGHSKKEAEKAAALDAVNKLGLIKDGKCQK